jgi:hypothetical protein
MNRRLALAVPVLALLVVAPTAALAHGDESHNKKLTERYTATAPVPNPTGCNGALPSSQHVHTVTSKLSGMLHVEVSGYAGNWDARIVDAAGKQLAAAGSLQQSTETLQVLVKARQKLSIVTCNVLGTSTATVRYGVLDAKAHGHH